MRQTARLTVLSGRAAVRKEAASFDKGQLDIAKFPTISSDLTLEVPCVFLNAFAEALMSAFSQQARCGADQSLLAAFQATHLPQ